MFRKFIFGFLVKKVDDAYFFLIRIISHFRVIGLFIKYIEVSLARYLNKNELES